MRQVDFREVMTELPKLLKDVEAGDRVVITRAGKPVAVLAPFKTVVKRRRLGLYAGQIKIHDDFDELPDDIAEAFGMK